MRMGRTFAASGLPAIAVAVSWSRLEEPRRMGELVLVVLLALVPALVRPGVFRALAAAAAVVALAWIGFGSQPWELLPFRDERVVGPLWETIRFGISDYYSIVLPFDPSRLVEMNAVLLVAVFGFVLASSLLVASRRPLGAAAVTVVAVGWPATLLDQAAVGIGALALAAALSISLVLRAQSARATVVGAIVAGLVVGGAAWASSATSFSRDAVLDWQTWDVRGASTEALGVRFVWDAQYEGIRFPPAKTTVLRIAGPDRAQYWRASTLDTFIADRWVEDLGLNVQRESSGPIRLDALAPAKARNEENWLVQRVEVKALVDERLVAAGTPVALEAPSVGPVFSFSGGVIRALRLLEEGTRYRVWSYVPDPTPAELVAAPSRYPAATSRFLTVWDRAFPGFGTSHREGRVSALLSDPARADLGAYRPLYEQARRVTAGTTSPYAAILALESWFRRRGGFHYDEQPPLSDRPPLVDFVTISRAGYCQHFAGAMAVMARLLGIPARVAVGFTSGKYRDGAWTVSDHNAHAWVEVWFPGHGWVPFDPTPGRGTFSASYTFASNSAATVEALRRGALDALTNPDRNPSVTDEASAIDARSDTGNRPSLLVLALVLSAIAAAGIGTFKWLLRRLSYITSDPRRAAAASRRELESYLRDQGVAVPQSATLDDLRRAAADELGFDAAAFVAAAGLARFGLPNGAPSAAKRARSELQALLRKGRGQLSIRARLRGFVSLRSLRGWQG